MGERFNWPGASRPTRSTRVNDQYIPVGTAAVVAAALLPHCSAWWCGGGGGRGRWWRMVGEGGGRVGGGGRGRLWRKMMVALLSFF